MQTSTNTKVCGKCSSVFAASFSKCPACGFAGPSVAQTAQSTATCPNCAALNPLRASNCAACGVAMHVAQGRTIRLLDPFVMKSLNIVKLIYTTLYILGLTQLILGVAFGIVGFMGSDNPFFGRAAALAAISYMVINATLCAFIFAVAEILRGIWTLAVHAAEK